MFMAPKITPGVKRLLVINLVVYVVYLIMLRSSALAPIAAALPMTPEDVIFGGRLWQPFTYMFIHHPAAVGHLLGNMLMLFFFGTNLERMVGTRKLQLVYLWSGLGGAAATVLASGLGAAIAPGSGLSALWISPHLGASGAVFGVVLCWGAMLWDERANFFLFGEMKVRTFVLIIVGIELLYLLSLSQGSSYTAHFGGMAVGYVIGRGGLSRFGGLASFSPRKRLARWRHKQTRERLRKFEVLEGGGENSNGKSKPGWARRDDDDPIVH